VVDRDSEAWGSAAPWCSAIMRPGARMESMELKERSGISLLGCSFFAGRRSRGLRSIDAAE
jgi:hypothetical protein